MHSIECRHCRWPWVTITPQTNPIPTFCVAVHIFVMSEHRLQIWCAGWCDKSAKFSLCGSFVVVLAAEAISQLLMDVRFTICSQLDKWTCFFVIIMSRVKCRSPSDAQRNCWRQTCRYTTLMHRLPHTIDLIHATTPSAISMYSAYGVRCCVGDACRRRWSFLSR